MHIPTHHDRIWSAGCQQKEDLIVEQLRNANPDAHIQLVDCLQFETDKTVITDNVFIHGRENTIQVNPEFWHIYLCDTIENQTPTHRLNCMLNRLSGERLLLLYKLHKRNLIDDNIVSFNCLYHTRDPDVEQRRKFFDQVHQELNWPHWDWAHKELKDCVPIIAEHDPDSAALASEVTIVTESYVSDSIIAFSEKIFRALQTPRPWLLFCSPGSVQLLKDSGFDVLDDIVDHSYDSIVDQEQRVDAILDELDCIVYDQERCEHAVAHNQKRLCELAVMWNNRFTLSQVDTTSIL
jgi:hypothetical protein